MTVDKPRRKACCDGRVVVLIVIPLRNVKLTEIDGQTVSYDFPRGDSHYMNFATESVPS